MKTKIPYLHTPTECADHLDIAIDGVRVNALLRGSVYGGFVVALIAANPDLVPDEIIDGHGWYRGKVSTCPRKTA